MILDCLSRGLPIVEFEKWMQRGPEFAAAPVENRCRPRLKRKEPKSRGAVEEHDWGPRSARTSA
jgi:hypothetical protein